MKFLKIFLLLVTSIFIYFVFLFWQHSFSKEVLKLEILGPGKVIAGEEVEFTVKYKNNGNFRLEEPELIVEFPKNSLTEEGFLERKILKEELGKIIYPGEEKSFHFKMKIFGKEGETKTFKASMSFRPKNLKARYVRETSFTTQIESVPLTFEFDFPTSIFPQKNFSFSIHYFSNANTVLENLRIQANWPAGFEFLNSNPSSFDKKEWEIPLLNKFEGGKIDILGRVYGEVGEIKIFKARIGILKEGEFILLKEIEKGIQLTKPSIFIRQEINGNPEYIASPGEWLHYEIYFKNIGEETLKNLFLICKLEGDAFDFETLKSETGNYEIGDNSIVFDWKDNPKLQILSPMEEGKVEFWIKLKEEILGIGEPKVKNKVFISQVKEEFVTKITSKIKIAQKGFFEEEVGFKNSGPLPPKVGQSTTYTIIWHIEGGTSLVKDLRLKAILPENVSLTGKVFPEEEISKFSFAQETREILWSIEKLDPREKKSLAFQISLLPTEKDRGKIPVLIGKLIAIGKDAWTGKEIKQEAKKITTLLPDDPSVNKEKAIVE